MPAREFPTDGDCCAPRSMRGAPGRAHGLRSEIVPETGLSAEPPEQRIEIDHIPDGTCNLAVVKQVRGRVKNHVRGTERRMFGPTSIERCSNRSDDGCRRLVFGRMAWCTSTTDPRSRCTIGGDSCIHRR